MDQTNEDYLKGVNFFLRPAIRQIRDFVFVERERNGGIYIAHFLVIAPPNECKVIQRKVQAMVNSYNDIYAFSLLRRYLNGIVHFNETKRSVIDASMT